MVRTVVTARRQRRALERELTRAATYADWHAAAVELDQLDGHAQWRADPTSPWYDAALLQAQLEKMRLLRSQGDGRRLASVLQESLYRHLGELGNSELYQVARAGTKHLIDDFFAEAEATIRYLRDSAIDGVSPAEKLAMFKQAQHNYGQTALMLSGGMAFGIYHVGVVKALWEQDLLPDVISGSSMGAIVAAGICSRSAEELELFFADPDLIHRKAVRLATFSQMLNERVVLSPEQLEEHIVANVNDLTFREAAIHSGRTLNITVSPTRSHQKPRVLCHLTAADVTIVSATIASCSIPGAFAPRTLTYRDEQGTSRPYMPTEKWLDGSVHGDIPLGRLSRLHNVNHSIVSLANPLVLPFVTHRRKKGVWPFTRHLASSFVHAQTAELLKVSRPAWEATPLEPLFERAHAVARQSYRGDINISFPFDPLYYSRVAANPDREGLLNYIRLGERATWPQLAMIRNQTRLGQLLLRSVRALQQTTTPA